MRALFHVSGDFDLTRIFPRLIRAPKCSECSLDAPRWMTVVEKIGIAADRSYAFRFPRGLTYCQFRGPYRDPTMAFSRAVGRGSGVGYQLLICDKNKTVERRGSAAFQLHGDLSMLKTRLL
jgi:hypothetical protein